jgi:hypothetical protein
VGERKRKQKRRYLNLELLFQFENFPDKFEIGKLEKKIFSDINEFYLIGFGFFIFSDFVVIYF